MATDEIAYTVFATLTVGFVHVVTTVNFAGTLRQWAESKVHSSFSLANHLEYKWASINLALALGAWALVLALFIHNVVENSDDDPYNFRNTMFHGEIIILLIRGGYRWLHKARFLNLYARNVKTHGHLDKHKEAEVWWATWGYAINNWTLFALFIFRVAFLWARGRPAAGAISREENTVWWLYTLSTLLTIFFYGLYLFNFHRCKRVSKPSNPSKPSKAQIVPATPDEMAEAAMNFMAKQPGSHAFALHSVVKPEDIANAIGKFSNEATTSGVQHEIGDPMTAAMWVGADLNAKAPKGASTLDMRTAVVARNGQNFVCTSPAVFSNAVRGIGATVHPLIRRDEVTGKYEPIGAKMEGSMVLFADVEAITRDYGLYTNGVWNGDMFGIGEYFYIPDVLVAALIASDFCHLLLLERSALYAVMLFFILNTWPIYTMCLSTRGSWWETWADSHMYGWAVVYAVPYLVTSQNDWYPLDPTWYDVVSNVSANNLTATTTTQGAAASITTALVGFFFLQLLYSWFRPCCKSDAPYSMKRRPDAVLRGNRLAPGWSHEIRRRT